MIQSFKIQKLFNSLFLFSLKESWLFLQWLFVNAVLLSFFRTTSIPPQLFMFFKEYYNDSDF